MHEVLVDLARRGRLPARTGTPEGGTGTILRGFVMNMTENFWRIDRGYAFVSGLFALLVGLLGIFAFWLLAKIYFIPELSRDC